MSSTYSDENKFRFDCDTIEEDDMPVNECMERLFQHMKGNGVQARVPIQCLIAMRAGKCPAFYMTQEEVRAGKNLYFSKDDRKGSPSKRVLEQIGAVLVMDYHMRSYEPDEEIKALFARKNAQARSFTSGEKRSPTIDPAARTSRKGGSTRVRRDKAAPTSSEPEFEVGSYSSVVSKLVQKETRESAQPVAGASASTSSTRESPRKESAPAGQKSTPAASANKPSLLELARQRKAAQS
jgi:hypothetical protein